MTVQDARLNQVILNIDEQRRWLNRVTWDVIKEDHAEGKDGEHAQDIRMLGIVDQLLMEVIALIKVVDESV